MSTNKIRFTLSDNQNYRSLVCKAAEYAFNLTVEESYRLFDRCSRIECRPDQFGLFIAKRYELGEKRKQSNGSFVNRITELNPEIVGQTNDVIDLSDRL